MKTVRVKRSKPSALSLALALLITMLFVYGISLSEQPEKAEKASAQAHMQQEIHLDALEARFSVFARAKDGYAARIEAANCAQSGGSGWIISDNGEYAVIFDMAKDNDMEENGGNIIKRASGGITLQISGRADEVSAVAEGAQFLRSMAVETGALAASVENGADASSVRALMGIYKTRADKICAALQSTQSPAAVLIRDAILRTSSRLDAAFSDVSASKIRLVHTAANAEWVSLIQELKKTGGE